ncbi:hypothetical protein HGM15179_020189 [Zosterops borbonicus]|uniref:Uncharacterized protein n=1 Tax=Zosterops borbonicus TaxID=364589 RepID=A0A8K1DA51_9PASS|nr:hypothetical protein HGM15179_020189 [Zosterops borbonicus]
MPGPAPVPGAVAALTNPSAGIDETFIKFIDRLRDTIDKQIDCSQAREELLSKPAASNANAECKKIIRALPLDSEPTIQQMVEACTRLTTMEHTVALAGTSIAQAFLLPTWTDIKPENPKVFWAEIVGQDRPLIECGLSNKGDKVYLPGVADTRAGVTIIARSKWPQGWELVPTNGVISRTGGVASSMQSKQTILIEGTEGQVATVRPFVTIQAIEGAGFEIVTEKIQCTCPWTYLGLRIGERTIVPQQLTIKDNPRTLRDLHQLCGSINWIHPLLGITTEDLVPLFNLLRGCDDLDSPRTITPQAQVVIQKVSEALSTRQVHHVDPTLPFQFVIMGSLEALLQTNEHLQFALDSDPGQISIHLPKHKLFNACFNLVPKSLKSRTPLKALTIFTDGSGGFHKSVMTWKNPDTQEWESDVQIVQGSPQIAELAPVVRAFEYK